MWVRVCACNVGKIIASVKTGPAKIGLNKVLINYEIIYLAGEQSVFISGESSG